MLGSMRLRNMVNAFQSPIKRLRETGSKDQTKLFIGNSSFYNPITVSEKQLTQEMGNSGFNVRLGERNVLIVEANDHAVPANLPNIEELGDDLLGRGSNGYAHRGRLFGEEVVFKRCYVFERSLLGVHSLEHETRVLSALRGAEKNHDGVQHLPKIICSGVDQNNIPYLAMAYRSGETLSQHIQSRNLSKRHICHIMMGIGEGLDLLGKYGIIHQDIKSDNILIDRETGNAVIIDLGEATAFRGIASTNEWQQLSGCPIIHPPEYYNGVAVPASDVWSAALLFAEYVLTPDEYRDFCVRLNNLIVNPPQSDPKVQKLIEEYFAKYEKCEGKHSWNPCQIMQHLLRCAIYMRPDARGLVSTFQTALCDLGDIENFSRRVSLEPEA
ncbi:protein kinase [Sansalvadorimonas sp. 2012CJ34-2]|uniref:Protein kinase n=1 Tax=Parendozoicomonas callyspongiae TaxID=2942213 RepID=A0ABT0PMW1_9GAMM|nr:protein kinase [Sansalvadorimonas sp. 2012CJ34-2]MCL6272077.1 protein kinase [Sansalvadorimonas sp. 2012CJ34-2]